MKLKSNLAGSWLSCIILASLLPASYGQEKDQLTKDDFGYAFNIKGIDNEQPFHLLKLPVEVYEKSVKDDLADVRVFNATGDILPASLYYQPQQNQQLDKQILRKFVINTPSPNQTNTADKQITLSDNGNNFIFKLNLLQPELIKKTSFYALMLPANTSQKNKLVRKLQLHWSNSSDTWQADVSFFDLAGRTIANSAVLANFYNQDGKEDKLVLNTIQTNLKLSQETPIILAITPRDTSQVPKIDSIEAISQTDNIKDEYIAIEGQPTIVDRQTVEYSFEHPQYFDYLSIEAATNNAVYRVNLEYKTTANQKEWQPLRNNLRLYRFNDSDLNPAIALPQTRLTALKLSIEQGSWSAAEIPSVIGKKKAFNLIFNSQGEKPYTLVVGQVSATNKFISNQELLGDKLYQNLITGKQSLAEAYLTERQTIIGETALTVPIELNYKKYIIWVLLVLGAGVLIFLAFKLLGELKQQSKQQN